MRWWVISALCMVGIVATCEVAVVIFGVWIALVMSCLLSRMWLCMLILVCAVILVGSLLVSAMVWYIVFVLRYVKFRCLVTVCAIVDFLVLVGLSMVMIMNGQIRSECTCLGSLMLLRRCGSGCGVLVARVSGTTLVYVLSS